jgi:hypothetical protein
MGSFIEVNDTLQITTAQGFPDDIFDRDNHVKNPVKLSDVKDQTFNFKDKVNPRIFHLDPVRVYFVHNINGKWLFWGRIVIQTQTIQKRLAADGSWAGEWVTNGSYQLIDVYEPDYQKVFTTREAPKGSNYFMD